MSTEQVVRSTCSLCRFHCGVLLHLANGKVTRIEGDPEHPVNKGNICIRGLASIELPYNPHRLKHPLKRVGEKGQGKWQEISWDEALNVVADELSKARDNYGAESVLFMRGDAKGLIDDFVTRFANVFGTPNEFGTHVVCMQPTGTATRITFGIFPPPPADYEGSPACILVWGSNVQATGAKEYWATLRALDKGAKLIVIDPRRIELAARADIWLQPRPSTDLALALGMLNVIINEGLIDKAFVDNWTVGFDELAAHVQNYPLKKVEEITWVDGEKIREAARFYASNRPACLQSGNGLEHNVNNVHTARAIWSMVAITGNFGVPGGNIGLTLPIAVRRGQPQFTLGEKTKDKPTVSDNKGLLPRPFSWIVPAHAVRAILEEDPYPVRAAYLHGKNPLVSYYNAKEWYKALKKLDFLVVADLFMMPSASLADIVLPVASFLEFDGISAMATCPVPSVQQKVAEVGECWSDFKILIELAKKLGLREYFWDDEEQFLEAMLKPAGITFEELRRMGRIRWSPLYRGYEKDGFNTPSGKVELYSDRLKEWGFDPLPVYKEPPETPYSDPEMAKEYNLIYTNYKSAAYRHSDGKQIQGLRTGEPEPIIEIHPETASKLGIKEGDWVYIETKRGRITQKAKLSTGIDPRVVYICYGWWYPEGDASTSYDWAKSNLNVLTGDTPPINPELGTPNMRGTLCKVYKV